MRIKKVYAILAAVAFLCVADMGWAEQLPKQNSPHTSGVGTQELPLEGSFVINKEGYSLHEVAVLDWGNKPDQVSIAQEGEYKAGPQNFVVDGSGNAFFDDFARKQIVRISSSGAISFIEGIEYVAGIFPDGRIFSGKGFIYDQKGKLLEKVRIPSTPEWNPKIIIRSDSIFILAGDRFRTLRLEDQRDKWGVRKAQFEEPVENLFPKLRHGRPSKFSKTLFAVSRSSDGWSIDSLDKKGKRTRYAKNNEEHLLSFYNQDAPNIIGDDDTGAIYSATGFEIKSSVFPKPGFIALQKHDHRGKLQLLIRAFSNWTGLEMKPMFDVDAKGDVYQLYSLEHGLRLVKWSR